MKTLLLAVALVSLLAGGCNSPPPRTLALDPPPPPYGFVPAAQPCIPQHNYRFQQNGAEILRMDQDTGEVCQLSSNQLNGWRFPACKTDAR